MSAYIVDNAHINAILNAIAPYHPGDSATYQWQGRLYHMAGDTQRLGQVLTDENYRSVNYRYQEQTEARRFQHVMLNRSFSPIEIVSLCHGYIYQACEHPEWQESEARAIVRALRERSIRRVEGYADAPWTISDKETVSAVVTVFP